MLGSLLADELRDARTVLVAGMGGGFDVFCGLPLYFALRAAGKAVHLANLSFSPLGRTTCRRVTGDCVLVTADDQPNHGYFPELYLSQWFHEQGEAVGVYAIEQVGAAPVRRAYAAIVAETGADAVVLVDGGTDSLMRGDEDGLGTPAEDAASLAAADALDDAAVRRKVLVCLGFGIDAFHGVSHAHVLENMAGLIRDGGYLGAVSLTKEMPEVRRFADATRAVLARMPGRESIVCTSIVAALAGHFGNVHATGRTAGSQLFINPLMSIYWAFRLPAVARRNLYLDRIGNTETLNGLEAAIGAARPKHLRPPVDLPI